MHAYYVLATRDDERKREGGGVGQHRYLQRCSERQRASGAACRAGRVVGLGDGGTSHRTDRRSERTWTRMRTRARTHKGPAQGERGLGGVVMGG